MARPYRLTTTLAPAGNAGSSLTPFLAGWVGRCVWRLGCGSSEDNRLTYPHQAVGATSYLTGQCCRRYRANMIVPHTQSSAGNSRSFARLQPGWPPWDCGESPRAAETSVEMRTVVHRIAGSPNSSAHHSTTDKTPSQPPGGFSAPRNRRSDRKDGSVTKTVADHSPRVSRAAGTFDDEQR